MCARGALSAHFLLSKDLEVAKRVERGARLQCTAQRSRRPAS